MLLKNIQLVVSRLFAGDNRLSPDILLVTTGCQQTKKSGDNRLSADLAIILRWRRHFKPCRPSLHSDLCC